MKCPKCADQSLEERIINEVAVDCCGGCRGVWFDQAELPRLLSARRSEVRALLKGRSHPTGDSIKGGCPRCGTTLLRVKSASNVTVVLDKCADCGGVWLDAGEFARLHEE